ncbi:MAG: hypothetical protein GY850_35730, partial [bacterium]|nr:hypothetical protein [bacterium]
DCDHAAYVSDSVSNNRVFKPGLNFTSKFDLPPQIIDLRPQLRAFPVKALTKDGIPLQVVTFIPFKFNTGRQVELGKSFPIRPRAICTAVAGGLVERKEDKKESGKKYKWDGQLVPLIATPIMQDIISRYKVDELCGPDSRADIADEIVEKVREAMRPWCIEVIGGGISNMVP